MHFKRGKCSKEGQGDQGNEIKGWEIFGCPDIWVYHFCHGRDNGKGLCELWSKTSGRQDSDVVGLGGEHLQDSEPRSTSNLILVIDMNVPENQSLVENYNLG